LPTNDVYIHVLSYCDHHKVAKAIAQVIVKARSEEQRGEDPSRLLAQQIHGEENLIHTAVDGKVMRGTLKHEREDQPPVHLLTFYECESGIILDQFSVEKKENEYLRCLAILHTLLVKWHILTEYLELSIKIGVQLCMQWVDITVYQSKITIQLAVSILFSFFEDEGIDRSEFHYYKEVNKGHGRLEIREIWTSTQMNEWFGKD